MKKNTLDELFNDLEGTFDVEQTPDGHQRRFMDRLKQQEASEQASDSRSWWRPLSIAASIIVIFGIGFMMSQQSEAPSGLASVSTELGQTENFFNTAISAEIAKLKTFESPETKGLVEDALSKVENLDIEYQKLREDLAISGNDKRVIHAMIANLQNRIDLLEQVVAMVEDLDNLKSKEDETII